MTGVEQAHEVTTTASRVVIALVFKALDGRLPAIRR
jgi:hypothetical protein